MFSRTKKRKPVLITVNGLSRLIERTLDGLLPKWLRTGVWLEAYREVGDEILGILYDRNLHISVHQSAADRWYTFLCDQGEEPRRWVIYRKDTPEQVRAIKSGAADVNEFQLSLHEGELSLVMIALERTIILSRHKHLAHSCDRAPSQRDEILDGIRKLFDRILLLPDRPPIHLDRNITI